MMRSIRKKDTGPERRIRRLIRSLGMGYRLHAADLPGSPDIVLRKRRKAIFVHGCFWHQHERCRLAKQPSARPEYRLPKLARNKARDNAAQAALAALGWEVFVVWECELADEGALRARVAEFLGGDLKRKVAERRAKALSGTRMGLM
jgi:DNA mismatch endonuclease (patch repair protein)